MLGIQVRLLSSHISSENHQQDPKRRELLDLMDQPVYSSPHVLMLPLPTQGDLKPMLRLAELLCLASLKVTFINSNYNHQRMNQNTDMEAHYSRYPGLTFELIPDGLHDDHPRSGVDSIPDWLQGIKSNATPILREKLLGSGKSSPVTCLIADCMLSFAYDIANEAGVPLIKFKGTSACYLWTKLCAPKLLEAGEIPLKDHQDMDELVQNVPGMTNFLRLRDLPSFFQIKDTHRSNPIFQFALKTVETELSHPIILNTFEELEGPVLSHLQACCPRIYSIGPLHAHLKYRLGNNESTSSTSLGTLWEMDPSCISWLDQKPNKSVIYVSFGSLTNLTRDQFFEFWAGLVQSNKYFLWVVRPNQVIGNDKDSPTPSELLEGTKQRGCMVGWAPQEEVLAHRAVGGFLTHSGWNSTLESIIAGVPMLCWPSFGDQQGNSRYVSEVWKIGLDMKDTCDRIIVEKMVSDLMDGRRYELERLMATMSHLAKRSITEGGSSHCNLDRLIADIKAMTKKAAH